MITSIVNQKGGVGKTTTSINLSVALAMKDKRVLLIDFDPQGNSSTSIGVEHVDRRCNIYTVLVGQCDVRDAISSTKIDNFDIISSTLDLAAVDVEFSNVKDKDFLLKKILAEVSDEYDYIIIDCPPSLGFMTINALVASGSVIIPMQSEFLALEGLKHLLSIVSRIKKVLNPSLFIEGIVLTMFDKRNKISASVEDEVRCILRDVVFDTIIPRNIKLAEAPSFGKPALIYDSKCLGSKAYFSLAEELLSRQAL